MKRSIMIERLINELVSEIPDLIKCVQVAEKVLTCCEDAGMQPPYNNGDLTLPDEWEPEDNGCGAV